jgi:hypothetical protein
MAQRPVFSPTRTAPFAVERMVDFQWFAGFALAQQRRSIASLHEAAGRSGLSPVLEISSKSPVELGVKLSAFNLRLRFGDASATVEAWFQSGKVFENGGPYLEFLTMPGRDIKRDERLRTSGRLREFRFSDEVWPLVPRTSFYDWLYLNALAQQPALSEQLLAFEGFTDIAFNPDKSLNCQARSAAMFVGLTRAGLADRIGQGRDGFISDVYGRRPAGPGLPGTQEQLVLVPPVNGESAQ